MLKKLSLTMVFCCLTFFLKAQADSSLFFEVYFPLDQHTLPVKEKQKVDSILQLAPLAIVKRVFIYGHTDSLAGVEYNRELSKNRVLSILQYFVYQGLDPLKVKTDFYGEERPKYDNGPDERFKNRRCEVLMEIDVSLLPKPTQKLSDLQLSKGDKLRIPNLIFVGNQPIPMWQSMPALKDIALLMKKNPDLKIEIQGHVCCSDDMELSRQRAFTVYNYLLANNIAKERMTYKGFSNSKPLFKETTRENRMLNRRVEIEVVENSNRRATILKQEDIIDIKAQVLNLKFFDNVARLMPSGDFMLALIAEMIEESEDLFYEFTVYDDIGNPVLTNQRALALEKLMKRKGVKQEKIKFDKMDAPNSWPKSAGDNFISVKISALKK